MPEPLTARSLEDISLTDADYKADFELTARFQSFSSELLRLSLLGIGLYGFVLAHSGAGTGKAGQLLEQTFTFRKTVAASLIMFGAASAFALAHGFCATKCLGFQLHIVRLLKRLSLQDRNEEEKGRIRENLKELQAGQKKILSRGLFCLEAATWILGLGALSITLAFCCALFTLS